MPMNPVVTYDARHRVFTVELERGKVARTARFDDAHLVDLDHGGRVLSIEVLTPDDPRIEDIAARFGIEDRVEAILKAITEQVPGSTSDTGVSRTKFVVTPDYQAPSPGSHRLIPSSKRSQGSVPARELDLA